MMKMRKRKTRTSSKQSMTSLPPQQQQPKRYSKLTKVVDPSSLAPTTSDMESVFSVITVTILLAVISSHQVTSAAQVASNINGQPISPNLSNHYHMNRLSQLALQQQQQPTVIQPSSAPRASPVNTNRPLANANTINGPQQTLVQQVPASEHFTGSQYQQYQQQLHRYSSSYTQQSYPRQYQHTYYHHHHSAAGNNQTTQASITMIEPLRMCQLSEPLMQMTKCRAQQEEDFKRTARAEFQEKLRETSSELRQLLASHLKEFRTVSLSLISFAESETVLKMNSLGGKQQGTGYELSNQLDATRQLFRALLKHLANYQGGSGGGGVPFHAGAQQRGAFYSTVADINQEIGYYFKRLHLIQLKRVLEQRMQMRHLPQVSLSIDCLDANLITQQHVESVLSELVDNSTATTTPPQGPQVSAEVVSTSGEQMKLTLSIKQSLEFARTLLSSLSLANDMFRNITELVDDWMPNEQCHRALARMTVCQQCHPSLSSASASQQQGTSPGAGASTLASLRRWVPLASSASASAAGVPFAADAAGSAPMRLVSQTTPAQNPIFMAAPCENYCLNVVGGCMSDLYELNRFWSEHVSALTRFKTNMIQMNNIESVMSTLADRLIGFMSKLRQQYTNAISEDNKEESNQNNSNNNSNEDSSQNEWTKLLVKSTEVSNIPGIECIE